MDPMAVTQPTFCGRCDGPLKGRNDANGPYGAALVCDNCAHLITKGSRASKGWRLTRKERDGNA